MPQLAKFLAHGSVRLVLEDRQRDEYRFLFRCPRTVAQRLYIPEQAQEYPIGPHFFVPSADDLICLGVERDVAQEEHEDFELGAREAYRDYLKAVERGVQPRTARLILPYGCYATWVWIADAQAVRDFLALQSTDGVPREIREASLALRRVVPHHLVRA